MLKFYNFSEGHQLLLIAALEDQIHNQNADPRGFKVEYDANGKKQFDYNDVVEAVECNWLDFHNNQVPYEVYDEVEEEENEPLEKDGSLFSNSGEECEGVCYVKVKAEYINSIGE